MQKAVAPGALSFFLGCADGGPYSPKAQRVGMSESALEGDNDHSRLAHSDPLCFRRVRTAVGTTEEEGQSTESYRLLHQPTSPEPPRIDEHKTGVRTQIHPVIHD